MKVSVVVPVYNTEAYLRECLDSLLAQDMPADEFEVVAVDDGSIDGSGQVLDDYAARHGNVRVIHQENSGWPGRPRNVGIETATGEYVFFADSDDHLGPEALRRMCAFAEDHGADVVVPKVVHDDGRPVARWVWRRTTIDADLRRVIATLGPWKLFRAELLEREGLRFPEGKVPIEDGIFVTEAYLRARRISVLADYDYYVKRRQPERGNISSRPVDPVAYASSIATMMAAVRSRCTDPVVADELIATLYRVKVLKWFAPKRFARYSASRRRRWVDAAAALAEDHVPVSLDEQLPLVPRIRSVLLRAREIEALRSLAEAQDAGRPLETNVTAASLELRIPGLAQQDVSLPVTSDLCLVAGPPPPPSPRSLPSHAVQPPPTGWWTTGPGRAVVRSARRRLWPVARRSTVGRRAWAWARDAFGPGVR